MHLGAREALQNPAVILLLGGLDRAFDQVDDNCVLNYNGYMLFELTIAILLPGSVDLLTQFGLAVDLLLEQRSDTDVLPAKVVCNSLSVLGFLTAGWAHEEDTSHYDCQLQFALTLLVRLLDALDQEVDRLLGFLEQQLLQQVFEHVVDLILLEVGLDALGELVLLVLVHLFEF